MNTVYLTGKMNGITFNVQILPTGRRDQEAKAEDIKPYPGAATFNENHPVSADPEDVKQSIPRKQVHRVKRKR